MREPGSDWATMKLSWPCALLPPGCLMYNKSVTNPLLYVVLAVTTRACVVWHVKEDKQGKIHFMPGSDALQVVCGVCVCRILRTGWSQSWSSPTQRRHSQMPSVLLHWRVKWEQQMPGSGTRTGDSRQFRLRLQM
mmetsp:Transcript_19503/g.45342  ORF Transcript_19503/g.45342 Transcript_19503/m.45342 type:complete len:135 (+) Transcript_19503:85-489(+)